MTMNMVSQERETNTAMDEGIPCFGGGRQDSLLFKLGFTPIDKEDEEPAPHRTSRGGKRNRARGRRRNAKSRKSQVGPMMAATTDNAPKKHHDAPMTKSDIYFALDCEMVGVGPEGLASVVARVTLVNWENEIVLDTFVKVPVPVTDYRTHVSGITAQDIESENAMTYEEVRSAVKDILRGKILIGHGLENDLTALGLTHPWCDVRDTACYASYMREVVDPQTGKLVVRPRKLRDLTWEVLGRLIQHDGNAHSPIDDAIASLDLYKAARFEWEKDLSQQQRVQEAEKQERRFKYNFFWNTMTQPPPSEFGVYNPIEPHNVHLLPIPIDPRLPLPDSYAGYPGYSPLPEPREEILPPPLTSSSPTSWFRFVLRPKTPPLSEEQEEKRAEIQEETTRTEEENEMEPINLELDQILPDIQYLSLDSQVSSTDSCVVGGLPFYSKSSIWR